MQWSGRKSCKIYECSIIAIYVILDATLFDIIV